MMTNGEAPFNLNEINAAWSELLSQYVMAKLSLEKEAAILRAENEDLQARLHQAEVDVIVAQRKQVIDNE